MYGCALQALAYSGHYLLCFAAKVLVPKGQLLIRYRNKVKCVLPSGKGSE